MLRVVKNHSSRNTFLCIYSRMHKNTAGSKERSKVTKEWCFRVLGNGTKILRNRRGSDVRGRWQLEEADWLLAHRSFTSDTHECVLVGVAASEEEAAVECEERGRCVAACRDGTDGPGWALTAP